MNKEDGNIKISDELLGNLIGLFEGNSELKDGVLKKFSDKMIIDYNHAKKRRSEEHTSELQSHSFISYAVFCLKKKKKQNKTKKKKKRRKEES